MDLYRRINCHGCQHWAFCVVTDWPGVIDLSGGCALQDPGQKVPPAIDRWPRGRSNGYMSTSPGLKPPQALDGPPRRQG